MGAGPLWASTTGFCGSCRECPGVCALLFICFGVKGDRGSARGRAPKVPGAAEGPRLVGRESWKVNLQKVGEDKLRGRWRRREEVSSAARDAGATAEHVALSLASSPSEPQFPYLLERRIGAR